MLQLRITEIFYSLQGEANTVGIPTIFIRLTGCPLRCQYCDTAYAFHGGKLMTFEEILTEVKKYNTKYVTVTGGEPLAQKNCIEFLKLLCNEDYLVSLETSGAIDVSEVDARVIKVIDVKTPASKESEKNYFANFDFLQQHDQIKFVICNKDDYEWSKQIINQFQLSKCVTVLFSPNQDELPAKDLADWILADGLNVRFQIQLHKYLWGNERGK